MRAITRTVRRALDVIATPPTYAPGRPLAVIVPGQRCVWAMCEHRDGRACPRCR